MARITIASQVSNANAITHSGVFHADDVLATVLLSKLLGDISVYRTFKVPEEIADSTIVYDIGYGKFDHHQKGGNGSRENGVPYAAAGLIWKEFGQKILTNTPNSNLVWQLIDSDLIQGVDAVDNGSIPKTDYPAVVKTFSNTISDFNPNWDSSETADDAFINACAFAEMVFNNVLSRSISKAKAQSLVETAISNSSEGILVLDQFLPWQDAIFSSENPKANDILFVVYPSNRGGFNWQCVPDNLGSFGTRKSVPASWKGLNGKALQDCTGVKSATFCHPAGFIGGAETLEDAIALTRIAINSET